MKQIFARGIHRSLMVTLFWLLIPALVVMMVLTLWFSNNALKSQVDMAYDRFLAGALKIVDLNLSTQAGALSMEQPFVMLEFFELTVDGRIHYRISTEDGKTEIGQSTIPMPPVPLLTGKPVFYETEVLGEKVRVAAVAKKMQPPNPTSPDVRVIIQVAENIDPRDAFIKVVVLNAIGRDAAAFLIGIFLVVLAVYIALRPLEKLHEQIEKRDADDLSPINDEDLPTEILPIVKATNLHMQRYAEQAKMQRQFLDDASHQLRTPLSVLKTQVTYALRENDIQEMRSALLAMQEGIDQATRMTNQMLSLAKTQDIMRAETDPSQELIHVNEMVQQVVRHVYSMARLKHIDLGAELSEKNLLITGHDWMIREAITNVLDNAISYSAPYQPVTILTGDQDDQIFIRILDAGPGINPKDLPMAGKRFWRGQAAKDSKGAGLGLAIVQSIMQWHHGRMEITSGIDSTGLSVTLWFDKPARENPKNRKKSSN